LSVFARSGKWRAIAALIRRNRVRSGVVVTLTATRPSGQHPAKFGERPWPIGKEHEAEMAYHRIEAAVGVMQRVGVQRLDDHRRLAELAPRDVEHRRRDVAGHDRPGWTDDRRGGLGGRTGSRRDIKHTVARRQACCFEYGR
jgi:hypothetical protein